MTVQELVPYSQEGPAILLNGLGPVVVILICIGKVQVGGALHFGGTRDAGWREFWQRAQGTCTTGKNMSSAPCKALCDAIKNPTAVAMSDTADCGPAQCSGMHRCQQPFWQALKFPSHL